MCYSDISFKRSPNENIILEKKMQQNKNILYLLATSGERKTRPKWLKTSRRGNAAGWCLCSINTQAAVRTVRWISVCPSVRRPLGRPPGQQGSGDKLTIWNQYIATINLVKDDRHVWNSSAFHLG